MVLIALKCPNCNGDIQLDDKNEFGFCMYCGSKVLLQEKLRQQVVLDNSNKIEGLLNTADCFYQDGSKNNAYDYAKQAISIDADTARAWYLVAKTTTSVSEKKVALRKVINLSDDATMVSECKEEYSRVQNKVVIRVKCEFGNNIGCTFFIDDKGNHVSGGSEYEIVVDKGIHKFKFNAASTKHIFGVKKDITHDCTVVLRWNKGAYVDFED